MNKRRLLKLADLLEADADNKNGVKFDLGMVVEINAREKIQEVPVSCGTTACAMGLAAISGAFKRAGLSYYIDDTFFDDGQEIYIETTMHGRVTDYDDAACELFDIGPREARFLFDTFFYSKREPTKGAKGERYVAKRIRDFVAGKVAPPSVE